MAFKNDEYIMLQNESDNRNIERQMALYGYETIGTDFFNTKEYERLIIELIKDKTQMEYNDNLPYRKLKLIKENAKRILIDQTKDINRLVPYMAHPSTEEYKFTAKYGEVEEENYDLYIRYLKKHTKLIDVTELPIKWKHKNIKNGQVNKIHEQTTDIEKIKSFPIIFTDIRIMNQSTDLTTSVLNHEMTHALLDRNKGIIKNMFHDELLSIYMEFKAAYKLDDREQLLKVALKDRILSVKAQIIEKYLNEFNGFISTEESQYIDSTLYALSLFETYKNSSNKGKKSITKEINKTLNGDRTLEDTLEKLDITEEEGSKILIKKLKELK